MKIEFGRDFGEYYHFGKLGRWLLEKSNFEWTWLIKSVRIGYVIKVHVSDGELTDMKTINKLINGNANEKLNILAKLASKEEYKW
jgi:hypothetical protein